MVSIFLILCFFWWIPFLKLKFLVPKLTCNFMQCQFLTFIKTSNIIKQFFHRKKKRKKLCLRNCHFTFGANVQGLVTVTYRTALGFFDWLVISHRGTTRTPLFFWQWDSKCQKKSTKRKKIKKKERIINRKIKVRWREINESGI